MINTKKNRSDLYLKLSDMDILTKLQKFFKERGYHITTDGKIAPVIRGIAWNVPWIYVKSHPLNRCDIGHRVLWDYFKIISSSCRECYKVVVRPRNLVELFDLYELQKGMSVPSKCGMENRKTVMGLYGGYFYNHSLEKGKERYDEVRELVNEWLSPKTPVVLKRYCTEFEIGITAKGASDKISELTEKEKYIEGIIESVFENTMNEHTTPDFLVAHVMRNWIHYAYQNGDKTYKKFTGGSPLFPPTVTYHNRED